jgi:hypothetical protein
LKISTTDAIGTNEDHGRPENLALIAQDSPFFKVYKIHKKNMIRSFQQTVKDPKTPQIQRNRARQCVLVAEQNPNKRSRSQTHRRPRRFGSFPHVRTRRKI